MANGVQSEGVEGEIEFLESCEEVVLEARAGSSSDDVESGALVRRVRKGEPWRRRKRFS